MKNIIKLYINSGSYKEYRDGYLTHNPDNYDRKDFLSMKKAIEAMKVEIANIQETYADKMIKYKVVDGSLLILIEKEKWYRIWLTGFRKYSKDSKKKYLKEVNNYFNSFVE